MDTNLALSGAFWGAVSAISLPLGAILGIWLNPPKRITSALMAFGGGALLFALAIELFGHALHKASNSQGHVDRPDFIFVTILGAIVGGLLFEGLNRGLDKWGAFMRKRSLVTARVGEQKRAQAKRLLAGLSKARLLRSLPIEDVIELVRHVSCVEIKEGETVFEEGEAGDAMYFIQSGRIDVSRGAVDGSMSNLASLPGGEVFGEIALFSEHPRTATAIASRDSELLRLSKASFDEIIATSPKLQEAMHDMVGERLDALAESSHVSSEDSDHWRAQAVERLGRLGVSATDADVDHAIEDQGGHGNAAMGIWMGIALDGFPEAMVIGMLVANAAAHGTSMSMAFVVAVFLANLPEAMSSSVTMHRTGASTRKILLMWGSLVVLTTFGGMIGAAWIPVDPQGLIEYLVLAIEGLAGGAMLTMIAATMLPEAFDQGGGSIVGMSTLLGFLAALSVRLMH